MKEKNNFWAGLITAKIRNKGKGWEEVRVGRGLFEYAFKCKNCGAQIEGFVVSPRFCPHCGKEHG